MTATGDELALLAGVAASPDDDVPRLVYADWLDEHHRHERAEFTRVGCDVPRCEWCGGSGRINRLTDCVPVCLARLDRERALFAAHAGVWWPGERVRLTERCDVCGGSGNGTMWAEGRPVRNCRGCQPWSLVVRRGFPDEWWGTCGAWCGERCENCEGMGKAEYEGGNGRTYRDVCHVCRGKRMVGGVAAAVRKAHPYLRTVRLTDKEPHQTEQEKDGRTVYCWWKPGHGPERSRLPAELWEALVPRNRGYVVPWDRITVHDKDTPADAHAALSVACLALARGVAGSRPGGEGGGDGQTP